MPDPELLMRRALELARQGIPGAFPNPVVGCVLEKGGEIVGEGAHLEFGGPHAEPNALAAAGYRAKARPPTSPSSPAPTTARRRRARKR